MAARSSTPRQPMLLLAHHHRDGFALEVGVRLAADVDGDPVDRASAEAPGHDARVVRGDTGSAVASDAQPLAADHELAGLCLDLRFADLLVTVEQRQGPV